MSTEVINYVLLQSEFRLGFCSESCFWSDDSYPGIQLETTGTRRSQGDVMKYKVAKRHCVRSSQGKLGLSSATTRFMSDYTTEYDSDAVKRHTKRPSLQPLLPVSRPQASAPSFFPSDSTSTQRDAATSGCSSRPFSGIFGLSSVQLSILPTPLVEGIRSHVGFLYVAAASACFTVVNSVSFFFSLRAKRFAWPP